MEIGNDGNESNQLHGAESLDNLLVAQLAKKFLAFCRIQKWIIVFSLARHWCPAYQMSPVYAPHTLSL
jgi:hypothetical protein